MTTDPTHQHGAFTSPVSAMGELIVTGLEKSYRGRTVVQDAGLTVHNGEAVGLLGSNGAGKTIIFYMIT